MLSFTALKPPRPQHLLQRLRPLHKVTEISTRIAAYCPVGMRNRCLQPLLNQALQTLIAEGELDFLRGRSCAIQIRNSRLRSIITFDGQRLLLLNDETEAEVTISSTTNGFLQLVTQRVDPDTLFFQRELLIEGDVELGLYLKNMLDALTNDDLPPVYRQAIIGLRKLAAMETPDQSF